MIERGEATQEEAVLERQSLGWMLLQQFGLWTKGKRIPAEKIAEIWMAIVAKYGLSDQLTEKPGGIPT